MSRLASAGPRGATSLGSTIAMKKQFQIPNAQRTRKTSTTSPMTKNNTWAALYQRHMGDTSTSVMFPTRSHPSYSPSICLIGWPWSRISRWARSGLLQQCRVPKASHTTGAKSDNNRMSSRSHRATGCTNTFIRIIENQLTYIKPL